MKISVNNLTKNFSSMDGGGNVAALNDVSFDIEQGQFFTLLGPSGCGKSTTLRCVAGLEHPDGGEIWLGDTLVASQDFVDGAERAADRHGVPVLCDLAAYDRASTMSPSRSSMAATGASAGRAHAPRSWKSLSLVQLEHLAAPAGALSQRRPAAARRAGAGARRRAGAAASRRAAQQSRCEAPRGAALRDQGPDAASSASPRSMSRMTSSRRCRCPTASR